MQDEPRRYSFLHRIVPPQLNVSGPVASETDRQSYRASFGLKYGWSKRKPRKSIADLFSSRGPGKIMKKLIAIACVLAVGASTFASGRAVAKAKLDNRADIQALEDQALAAMRNKDTKALMALYSEQPLFFDAVPPMQYAGRDAVQKDDQSFFDSFNGPLTVESREMNITADSKVAFATYLLRIAGTMKSGQKMDIWFRNTDCLVKHEGRWRIAHTHFSVPVDLGTGKADLTLKP
jgi:uncharacterized protein (TIGR02246 family)